MKQFSSFWLLLQASTARLATANTEKVIFLGPPAINVPLGGPTISDLNLDVLTPDNASIRTNLTRVFPTVKPAQLTELDAEDNDEHRLKGVIPGFYSWFILDGLVEKQRYELRVCWSALQPTSFSLDVYEVDAVWQIPELILSLDSFSRSRLPGTDAPINDEDQKPRVHKAAAASNDEVQKSALFLRVSAAADYFTDDLPLMRDPPPVLVDIILDPYLYNLLPHSLMLTAVYVVLVAILSFYVARWIASYLQNIADEPPILSQSKKTN